MSAARTLIALAVTLVALSATLVAAMADASVRLLGRRRIHRIAESGVRNSSSLESLSEHPGRVAAVHAFVSGGAFATVGVAAFWVLQAVWSGTPTWVDAVAAAIVASVVLFVFGEALPRALAAANAEGAGLAAAPMASVVGVIAYPAAAVLSAPWRWIVALVTGERAPEVPWVEAEEARAEEEPTGESTPEALMEALSELAEKIVREVMVPRTDMICLEDTTTIEEAIRVVTAAGVSRVPVYHETVDDVRGVLYAKDLLRCVWDTKCSRLVADHMREAFFVPETKPVEELLREMRRRTHLAIVLDEYGGTAGLVTIEDLVEEIVGEIYDEYDLQIQMLTDLGGGRYRIDGRYSIDDMNELFDTEIETEADTAGGLVSELAGHIPEVGESVEVEGLKITVAIKEGNRIRELLVEPSPLAGEGKDVT